MQIDYGFTKLKGEGRVFLRNNNCVAYFPNDFSYYFGISRLHHFEQPVKIFDSIISSNTEAMKVGKNFAVLTINKKKHQVIMGEHCLNIDYATEQFLDLDFRGLYDFRTAGRYYDVEKNDYYEIKCKQGNEFYWVIIDGNLELMQEWKEKYYPFDEARGDSKSFWVHRLGKIKGKARISWGKNKEHAIQRLQKVNKEEFASFEELIEHNLNSLIMNERLYAGLPWFFQAWTRDELISLVAYDPGLRKKLLINYLNSLMPDGRLPNRLPEADLGSADSIGLLAFRVKQNLILFNEQEKKQFLELFQKANELLKKNYMIQGLIWNRPNETWMDTNNRAGYCIEIQALYACLLEVIEKLGGEVSVNDFVTTFRSKFQNIDNLEDNVVRPNIFLAYYFFPKLFDDATWKLKFETVINDCWLDWGGFSTVSKNHYSFHPKDMGINDESYHNGNSWYFVNNIAAMGLNKLGFEEKARKIYLASKHEILSSGLLGCAAEISDAESLNSKGCLHQNWSIATIKELNLILNNSEHAIKDGQK